MELSKILPLVEKPARYTGGELNMAVKQNEEVRFVFAFPDLYEIGMSHLGGKIIYHALNEREDTYCERVYAPWTDMEGLMRQNNIPLFSLETKRPVKDADLFGFTLQYEMCYTTVINMIDLAGLPLLAADRTEGPFVFAGGPCTYHAEPLAPFMDFYALGDGEEELNDLIEIYKEWKKSGRERKEFLRALARTQGFYVPSFYDIEYYEDGRIKSITPNEPDAPLMAVRRIVEDFENAYYPVKPVVPYIEAVHDRVMLEILRGCTRGCRFCQAGYIYRPVRERSVNKLCELAEETIKNTGYDEISLTSLSSGDYSRLPELLERMSDAFKGRRVTCSLPSLRLDSFSVDSVSDEMRRTSLTFAPEAGSQRLRDVINKNVTQEDFARTMRTVFEAGYNSVKLYFMLGLPTETDEDIAGIARLAQLCSDIYREVRGSLRGFKMVVSTSFFVPKPFTPFQWCALNGLEEQNRKREYLAGLLKPIKGVEYRWHETKGSVIEAALARGDRRMGEVLKRVWQKGARLEGWNEYFNFARWQEAFEECGLNLDFYALRARELDEIFPWETVDCGVRRKYLESEYNKSLRAETTRDCRQGCTGCGMNALAGGKCPCER